MNASLSSCLLLLASAAAAAGTPSANESARHSVRVPRFEVTPYAGYRLGGDFELEDEDTDADLDDHGSWALALNLARDPWSQYELFYGRQQTALERNSPLGALGVDVEYLHIGGTLIGSEARRFAPYLLATIGATRFTPDIGGADDSTHFSFSLGGGLRVPVSERLSLRLEARGFLTFVDTDTALFCKSGELGGICSVRASGSSFVQFELLAGAAFGF